MTDDRRAEPGREELKQQQHASRTGSTYAAFLKALTADGIYSEPFAENAATSVLCCLEQRILADEAEHMEAQLPMKLRELLVRCHRHRDVKPLKFGRDELLAMIADDLGINLMEAERVALRVMNTVRTFISEGEAEKVEGQLPPDIRELWRRPS